MTTRKNEPLRIHKTPLNQRRTYTYNFYIDSKVQKVILHPDKDGVTEELIKKLHTQKAGQRKRSVKAVIHLK